MADLEEMYLLALGTRAPTPAPLLPGLAPFAQMLHLPLKLDNRQAAPQVAMSVLASHMTLSLNACVKLMHANSRRILAYLSQETAAYCNHPPATRPGVLLLSTAPMDHRELVL